MKTLAAATRRTQLLYIPKSSPVIRTYSVARLHHYTRQKRNPKHVGLFAVLAVTGTVGIVLFTRHYFQAFDFLRSPRSLNPDTFTPYTLTAKDYISTDNAIFTLVGPGIADVDGVHRSTENTLSSIQIKQPELQIARAYTPLPSQSIDENGSLVLAIEESPLQFLIKREEKGEVSRYLHNLPIGSQVEVRGPKIEYKLPHNLQEVVFIAGGTGVVPALQVAKLLQNRPSTKMHIFWANRKEEDVVGNRVNETKASNKDISTTAYQKHPVLEKLEILKLQRDGEGYKTLSFDIFVDDRNHYISINDVKRHTAIRTGNDQVAKSRLILVSGPDGFVEYWAGPKVWKNGQETQGQLGGLLSQLKLDQWQTWKL